MVGFMCGGVNRGGSYGSGKTLDLHFRETIHKPYEVWIKDCRPGDQVGVRCYRKWKQWFSQNIEMYN